MSRLSGAINGQKKIIIDDKTQKEEEILFLFSNPINNNQKIVKLLQNQFVNLF